MSTRGFVPGQACDVADGARLSDYPGGKAIGKAEGDVTRQLLGYSPNGRDFALVTTDLGTGRTAWVRASRVANARPGDVVGDRFAEGRLVGLEEAEAAVVAVDR